MSSVNKKSKRLVTVKSHMNGRSLKVECVPCYDEFGSQACLRPAHGIYDGSSPAKMPLTDENPFAKIPFPAPKKIDFVSNYFNDRVGMYVDGTLVLEQDDTHGFGFEENGRRYQMPNHVDLFQHAADLFSVAGVPYAWREADPSWLKRRKKFPRDLSVVKFA